MDVLTKEQRRKNMQSIRSKDTSIELTRYKIAVFCDSEFFHGKDWDALKARLSRSDKGEYWIKKIERNMARDVEVEKELNYLGWKVIRFWGKDIKKNPETCVQVIREAFFDELIEKNELS